MKVKIGAQWFDVTDDQPIMIVMTPADRANIAAMPPENMHYAVFGPGDIRPASDKLDWMKAPRR